MSSRSIIVAIGCCLITGCIQHGPARTHPEPPATSSDEVAYKPVGIDENGCVMYTKVHSNPDMAVDAAIWFKAESGDYTLDASKCAPVEIKENHQE